MDEVDPGQPNPNLATPARPGERLRAAREAHGLSLAEIAARTRVPQRHLEALETGDYAALPSPTYAVGFARAFARTIGDDEVAVAQGVRHELDRMGTRRPEYVPYETADPARVPSRGIAVVGVGVALAILILTALWYGSDVFTRGGGTTTSQEVVSQPVASAPPRAAAPVAPVGGQVALIANDEVWLRVYDGDNATLYTGTMKQGERFDVPITAKDPMINVGRPDKLAITLNGSAIPPLGDGSRPIKDVRVSGAAIAARLAASPTAAAPSSGGANPAATGNATVSAPEAP